MGAWVPGPPPLGSWGASRGLPGGGSRPKVCGPEMGKPSWFRTSYLYVSVCGSRSGERALYAEIGSWAVQDGHVAPRGTQDLARPFQDRFKTLPGPPKTLLRGTLPRAAQELPERP